MFIEAWGLDLPCGQHIIDGQKIFKSSNADKTSCIQYNFEGHNKIKKLNKQKEIISFYQKIFNHKNDLPGITSCVESYSTFTIALYSPIHHTR